MNPIEKVGLMIIGALLLALVMDYFSWRKARRSRDRYTLPQKTGQYRLQEVKYNGKTFMCLQTEWEKWHIDENMNGRREVYWKWSTMAEIKDWHKLNYGG